MSSAEILASLQSIEKRLAAIESKMGNDTSSVVVGEASLADELPRSVKGFDIYSVNALSPFVAASAKLGGDAERGGKLVAEAWGLSCCSICIFYLYFILLLKFSERCARSC